MDAWLCAAWAMVSSGHMARSAGPGGAPTSTCPAPARLAAPLALFSEV